MLLILYQRQPTIQEILALFTSWHMLQASKQVKEGTSNNYQTNDIAAQETRRTPKRITYKDYCVTKVSQHNIFINNYPKFNPRVASKQLQIFLPSLMKELIPVMIFTSLLVEALLRRQSSQMIRQVFPCFQFWGTSSINRYVWSSFIPFILIILSTG